MDPQCLKEYAGVMRDIGIYRFKLQDVEFIMGTPPENFQDDYPSSEDSHAVDVEPIKHKVEEMSSLLKLNDQDLVDHLFPDTDKWADSNQEAS